MVARTFVLVARSAEEIAHDQSCDLCREFLSKNQPHHKIITLAADPVFVFDLHGAYLYANFAAKSMVQFECTGPVRVLLENLLDIDIAALMVAVEKTGASARASGVLKSPGSASLAISIECIYSHDIDGAEYFYLRIQGGAEISRLRAEVAQQHKRAADLCRLAFYSGAAGTARIDLALAVAVKDLSLRYAFMAVADGDSFRVENAVGEAQVNVGTVFAKSEMYLLETCLQKELFYITDEANGSYAAAPIFMNGKLYGVAGFVFSTNAQMCETDSTFLKLTAHLITSTIEIHDKNVELDRLAYFDSLTGLANRSRFLTHIASAISLGTRYDRPFALHYIDLDRFKAVNDNAGHAIGDLVLKETAHRLSTVGRSYDVAARYGGDEFLFLQNEVHDQRFTELFATRLVEMLCEPYEILGATYQLGASVGVAMFPLHASTTDDLLKKADAALYKAKENGRNCFRIFET